MYSFVKRTVDTLVPLEKYLNLLVYDAFSSKKNSFISCGVGLVGWLVGWGPCPPMHPYKVRWRRTPTAALGSPLTTTSSTRPSPYTTRPRNDACSGLGQRIRQRACLCRQRLGWRANGPMKDIVGQQHEIDSSVDRGRSRYSG
jgi:hypothetical protein